MHANPSKLALVVEACEQATDDAEIEDVVVIGVACSGSLFETFPKDRGGSSEES